MSEYQAISAKRLCFQAGALLCAYAAARYQKLTLPRNPALAFVAAGILQGVSTRVRTPLGERSKWNWLLDGVSLGLIAWGTSKLELAQRVKYLTGGAMVGTQLLISNARPHTFFGQVAAAETEEAVDALYDKLEAIEDQLTPQDLIRACIALFSKAIPFSLDDWGNSIASKLLQIKKSAIKNLSGWEKAAAQMQHHELSNEHRVYTSRIDFSSDISSEGLSATEKDKRQEWIDTTGLWMMHRWAIWDDMEQKDLEERWNALKGVMEADGCRLTFDQKIDLCNEYIKEAKHLEKGVKIGDFTDQACTFKEGLIRGLDGFEKCKAYMEHAEFYSKACIVCRRLFDVIFPDIRGTLSPSEQGQFEKWMEKTGNAIKANWEKG